MKNLTLVLIILILPTALAAQVTEASAKKLYDGGRFQKAVTAYEGLMAKNGKTTSLMMGLGKSLFGLKEGRRSLALFQEVAGMDEKHAGARFWTGRVLERKGLDDLESGKALAGADLRDAVAFYQEAAGLMENPFEAHFAAGRTLMYLLDFEAAVKELKLAEKAQPGDEQVRVHMLGALYRSGNYEAFLTLARKDNAGIDRVLEFDAVIRLGRLEEAKALFIDLMVKHGYSNQTKAYDVLYKAGVETKKPQFEVSLLRALLDVKPDENFANFYLACAEARQQDLDSAEKHFRVYLSKAGNEWGTLGRLARVLRANGKLTESEVEIRSAMRLQGDAQFLHDEVASLVGAYVEKRQFEKALYLHELLLRKSQAADVRRNHAILLKDNSRLEDAVTMLKALCEEESVEGFRLSGFWNDLGLCQNGLKRPGAAERAFRQAIKVFSDNPDAKENLGVLLFSQGKFLEAEKQFNAAIESRQKSSETREDQNFRSRYYLGLIKSARIQVPKSVRSPSR